MLDALILALLAILGPINLSGVEHSVATTTNVNEGGLHRRQDVLHFAQVDIADRGGGRSAINVMLNEHPIFQHRQLRVVIRLTHNHLAVDRLATGQELRVGDDGTAATSGGTSFPTTLLLSLDTGRTLDASDLISHRLTRPRLAHLDDDVAGIIVRTADVFATTTTAATTTVGGVRATGLRIIVRAGL